jgi:hypothetical protein
LTLSLPLFKFLANNGSGGKRDDDPHDGYDIRKLPGSEREWLCRRKEPVSLFERHVISPDYIHTIPLRLKRQAEENCFGPVHRNRNAGNRKLNMRRFE